MATKTVGLFRLRDQVNGDLRADDMVAAYEIDDAVETPFTIGNGELYGAVLPVSLSTVREIFSRHDGVSVPSYMLCRADTVGASVIAAGSVIDVASAASVKVRMGDCADAFAYDKAADFLSLVREAVFPSLLSDRVGARKSVFRAQSDEIDEDVLDVKHVSMPRVRSTRSPGSLRTNFNWLKDSTGGPSIEWVADNEDDITVSMVDELIGRVQTNAPSSNVDRKVWSRISGAPNGTYTFQIQVKGTGGGFIAIVNDGSDTIKEQTNFTATNDWQTVVVTGTTDGGVAGVRFNIYGDDSSDLYYRHPVAVLGDFIPDEYDTPGIPAVSSLIGATNLVDTDLMEWENVKSSNSDEGDGVFKIIEDTSDGQHFAYHNVVLVDNEFATFTFDVRPAGREWIGLQAVTRAPGYPTVPIDLSASGSGSNGDFSVTWTMLNDGWLRVTGFISDIDSGAATPRFGILLSEGYSDYNYIGDGVSGVEVRNLRASKLAAPVAALPDYGSSIINKNPANAADVGGNTTVTDNGSGDYRIQLPDGGGSYIHLYSGAALPADGYVFMMEYRKTPGAENTGTLLVESQVGGVPNTGQIYVNSLDSIPDDWQSIAIVRSESGNADILSLSDMGGGIDIEVRNMRFVQQGSGLGALYGTDNAGVAVGYSAQGCMFGMFDPIGWDGGAHPENNNARLVDVGPFDIYCGYNEFFLHINSVKEITSTKGAVDGQVIFWYLDWDGVNVRLQMGDEAIQSFASGETPTGPLYFGNTSSGDRPSHAVQCLGMLDRIPTDDEREALRLGFESIKLEKR